MLKIYRRGKSTDKVGIYEGGRRKSGICEPIAEGIFVNGDYGAIAIHFKPGEEWKFKQDEDHEDRLIAYRDCRESVSLTISKFYEIFRIKESK